VVAVYVAKLLIGSLTHFLSYLPFVSGARSF
jgi:hypothetical protein